VDSGGKCAHVCVMQVATHTELPPQSRPTLWWREATVQVFPIESGLYRAAGGVPTAGEFGAGRAGCAPLAQAQEQRNAATNPIFEAAGVPVVRVSLATACRWNEYIGYIPVGERGSRAATQRRKASPTLDCTHICLPSGLMDHLTERLLIMLIVRTDTSRLLPTV